MVCSSSDEEYALSDSNILTFYTTMWYILSKYFSLFWQGGKAHGQSRVLLISPETPKDAERNGGASGNFS
jgi:hypothetical protein